MDIEIVTCIHLPWLCWNTRGYVFAQQNHATKQGQARWNCMEAAERIYLACRISYATTWLADELVKLNATLGSLDKHCTLVPIDSWCHQHSRLLIKLWIYAMGLKDADLCKSDCSNPPCDHIHVRLYECVLLVCATCSSQQCFPSARINFMPVMRIWTFIGYRVILRLQCWSEI